METPLINGCDLSDFQATVDFSQVKTDPNGGFVFAQASYGASGRDTNFRTYHDGAKNAGIPFGPYHFFYASGGGQANAQNFLGAIDGFEGQLLPMVDVESASIQDYSGNSTDFLNELTAFDQTVRASLPVSKLPIIYTGYSFWESYTDGSSDFSGHPLWVAAYNDDATLDVTALGWQAWTLWQYSSSGKVAGISGNVDLDRLTSLEAITR